MIDGLLTNAFGRRPAADRLHAVRPFEASRLRAHGVRIAYDDAAIYVGSCSRQRPSQIVTPPPAPDATNEMDSFQIIFDTYGDRQNGFVFGTNALGVQTTRSARSGQHRIDLGRQLDVRTNVTESGWTAEFRIPLRTRGTDLRRRRGIQRLRNISAIASGRTGHRWRA